MSFAETTPITIKYSITLYDLIKCRLWLAAHSRFLVGLLCIFSLLIPLQVCNESQFSKQTIGVKVIMFFMVFAIISAFLAIVELVIMILFTLVSKNLGLLGRHELEIGEDGLAERTEINESLYRWSGFQKLRKSRNYLFLYVTDHSAHVVPKRAFSSARAAAEFENRILQLAGRR